MARRLVSSYAEFQNVGGTSDIVLYYPEGDASTITGVPRAEADFIIDLLRNEKPISYDADRKRLSTYSLEPVGELEQEPDLNAWLLAHPSVCAALIWETPNGIEEYPAWPAGRKQALANAFGAAWRRGSIALVDPPPNAVNPGDDEYARTVLAETYALPLFLATVAQSLAVEIGNWVPWSILGYSAGNLQTLLDSRETFRWDAGSNGYELQDGKGGHVLPAPPAQTYAFLGTNALIGYNQLDTITRVVTWCHDNLVHFSGGFTTKNVEDQWQYRGYPPVTRVISGTPKTGSPPDDIRHRTAGCHGTNGFLRALLRVVNIPVLHMHVCGHALPYFTTVARHLTHGDDPYNALTRATPPFSMGELLIDQAKYDAWFGAGVSDDDKCDNVGRRTRELAVQYLPNYLLHRYCTDMANNLSHADGQVFDTLDRNYTVAELEAANLWTRMDDKIASFGGCANVPA